MIGPMIRAILLALVALVGVVLPSATVAPALAAQARATAKVNTWTARSSTGQIFAGTWTVTPADDDTTATGTWTLDNAQRRMVARGTWSASKATAGWNGAWRASTTGSAASYAGSWSAPLPLDTTASFARLFEAAADAAVSGTWRASALSGSWSIRVFN